MVENGHYFAKSCRYEDANRLYQRVLEQEPDDYSALTSRLIVLAEKAKQEKNSGVVPDYSDIDELLKKDAIRLRTSSALRFNLGSIAVLKEDFDRAAGYYQDAHQLAGTFPQALRNEALSSMILSGINDEYLMLLDEAIEEANSLELDVKVPVVNENHTQDELRQMLLGFSGFVSDHDDLSEQDPVLEVRHDNLYPGAPCK